MSNTRRYTVKIDPKTSASLPTNAALPAGHHLVIATEDRIVSHDQTGASTLFESESRGILAAKAINNGSGTLAIADDQVVLLHESDQRSHEAHKLRGASTRTRLLEFSTDSSLLFFTTALLNAVQVYSVRDQRLLDPGPLHPTQPTVLAVSPTSHLMLSASRAPSIIQLYNLRMRTAPIVLRFASTMAVTSAAFHPDRCHIFAVALQDGSALMFDATKLGKMEPTYGEVASIVKLHAVVGQTEYKDRTPGSSPLSRAESASSASITGIGFLPGSKMRAVTVGADGKCNVVDFGTRQVLKTWHVKGPATCLTICKRQHTMSSGTSSTVTTRAGMAVQSRDVLLAIGRADGKVVIYNATGTAVMEEPISLGSGRIIDVQWIRGPRTKSKGETIKINAAKGAFWVDTYGNDGHLRSRTQTESSSEEIEATHSTVGGPKHQSFSWDDQPATLSRPQFDDLAPEPGTVLRGQPTFAPIPVSADLNQAAYMDLFSPIKPSQPVKLPASPARKLPMRSRARISSSTFDSCQSYPPAAVIAQYEPTRWSGEPSNSADSHAHELASSPIARRDIQDFRTHQRGSREHTTSELSRAIPGAYLRSVSSVSTTPVSVASSKSSQILSDILRLTGSSHRGNSSTGDVAPLSAPILGSYRPRSRRKSLGRSGTVKANSSRRRSSMAVQKAVPTKVEVDRAVRGNASETTESLISMESIPVIIDHDPKPASAEHDTGDIWLTDGSSEDDSHRSKVRNTGTRSRRVRRPEANLAMSGALRADAAKPIPKSPPVISERLSSSISPGYSAHAAPGRIAQRVGHGISTPDPTQSSSTIYPTIDPSPPDSRTTSISLLYNDAAPTPSTIYPAINPSQATSDILIRSYPPTPPDITSQYQFTKPIHPVQRDTSSSESDATTAQHQRFYSAAESLSPGYADSRVGPVEVERWLPQYGSLALALRDSGMKRSKGRADGGTRAQRRGVPETVSGNGHGRTRSHECCDCCHVLQDESLALRAEVERLRGVTASIQC